MLLQLKKKIVVEWVWAELVPRYHAHVFLFMACDRDVAEVRIWDLNDASEVTPTTG